MSLKFETARISSAKAEQPREEELSQETGLLKLTCIYNKLLSVGIFSELSGERLRKLCENKEMLKFVIDLATREKAFALLKKIIQSDVEISSSLSNITDLFSFLRKNNIFTKNDCLNSSKLLLLLLKEGFMEDLLILLEAKNDILKILQNEEINLDELKPILTDKDLISQGVEYAISQNEFNPEEFVRNALLKLGCKEENLHSASS